MTLIYDVSQILRDGMPGYPGDPPVKIREIFTVAKEGFSLRQMELTTHTGTHVDFPRHFYSGGVSQSETDLSIFFGKVQVAESFEDTLHPGILRFFAKNGHLSLARAQELHAEGVRLIGTVFDSIEIDSPYPLHEFLLGNGIIILENLVLSGMAPGEYHLAAFPLNIEGADGAPVRAVLMDDLCGGG